MADCQALQLTATGVVWSGTIELLISEIAQARHKGVAKKVAEGEELLRESVRIRVMLTGA